MSEHFIRNIEIKNYKLFKDFKADGFGRVNLIGGKNNAGKTAFMEACYLSQAIDTKNLFARLLEIKTHRNLINNLLSKNNRNDDLQILIKENIGIELFVPGNGGSDLQEEKDSFGNVIHGYKEWENGLIKIDEESGTIYIYSKFTQLNASPPFQNEYETIYPSYPDKQTLSNLIHMLDFDFESTKVLFSTHYISPYSNSNKELENIIGDLKLNKKYTKLVNYLKNVFDIDSMDIIKDKPMLEIKGSYLELSDFGQGVKSFINIVASLLLLEKDYLFIDEIENGIHYTNLDKLWEIILTLSKEQNVQVFATTHSKECIESFNRVQKELNDQDTYYFEMAKNSKTNETFMTQIDMEQLEYELKNNERIRGE